MSTITQSGQVVVPLQASTPAQVTNAGAKAAYEAETGKNLDKTPMGGGFAMNKVLFYIALFLLLVAGLAGIGAGAAALATQQNLALNINTGIQGALIATGVIALVAVICGCAGVVKPRRKWLMAFIVFSWIAAALALIVAILATVNYTSYWSNPSANAKAYWDSITPQAKGIFAQTFSCSGAWDTDPAKPTPPGCSAAWISQTGIVYTSTMGAAWGLLCLLVVSIAIAWCLRRSIRDHLHKKELEAAAEQARAEAKAEATTQYNQQIAAIQMQNQPKYATSVYGSQAPGVGYTQAYVPQFGVNTTAEPGRKHPGYSTVAPSNAIITAPATTGYAAPTYGLAVASAPTTNVVPGVSNLATGTAIPSTSVGTVVPGATYDATLAGPEYAGVGTIAPSVTTSGSIVPPTTVV